MLCIYLQAHIEQLAKLVENGLLETNFISAVSLSQLYTCEDFLTGTEDNIFAIDETD